MPDHLRKLQARLREEQAEAERTRETDTERMHARCIDLAGMADHPMAWALGRILINGRELPFDATVCDWIDRNVLPPHWHVIKRPRNR